MGYDGLAVERSEFDSSGSVARRVRKGHSVRLEGCLTGFLGGNSQRMVGRRMEGVSSRGNCLQGQKGSRYYVPVRLLDTSFGRGTGAACRPVRKIDRGSQ